MKLVLQCVGVKSPSTVALHKPFDICRGMVIDSLNSLYLGVTLKLMKLWKPEGKNFLSEATLVLVSPIDLEVNNE